MEPLLRYGIIGCGSMGREHIENLRALPGTQVTAIADVDAGSRQTAQALLPDTVPVFATPQALLDSGACDIVVSVRPAAQAARVASPDCQLLDFGGGEGDFEVSEEEINIGISLKKGNTALKDAINEVLSTMTTDDYNAMMDQAIEAQPLNQG